MLHVLRQRPIQQNEETRREDTGNTINHTKTETQIIPCCLKDLVLLYRHFHSMLRTEINNNGERKEDVHKI